MDMRFGTWNVTSLCRAGSLKTVANELAKYSVNVVTAQEVRWVEGGSQPPDDYTVLNVHSSTEDKSEDAKDSFFKELQHVFSQFPKV
jgi:exonuclease III